MDTRAYPTSNAVMAHLLHSAGPKSISAYRHRLEPVIKDPSDPLAIAS